MDDRCTIELLGVLRVRRGAREITRFQTRQTGALLAYLAYFSQRVPRDPLAEIIWPEDDESKARQKLRRALNALRNILEPPDVPRNAILKADRISVALNGTAVTTDVAAFRTALQQAARASGSLERAQLLAEAVELYRGELLRGYGDSWILVEREQLAEYYSQAVLQLLKHREAVGDLRGALEAARQGVSVDPLREELHRELIRLLAAMGQPAAARRQFRELERILREELGVTPEAATLELTRGLKRLSAGRTTAAPLVRTPPLTRTPTGTVTLLAVELQIALRGGKLSPSSFTGVELRAHALVAQHEGELVEDTDGWLLCAFGRASDALACATAILRDWAAAPGHDSAAHADCGPRLALDTGETTEAGPESLDGLRQQVMKLVRAAHPGQVLCSEETAILLRRHLPPDVRLEDLGCYRLRGMVIPGRLFNVRCPEIEPRAFPPPNAEPFPSGRLPLQFTRFFGRDAEITHLRVLLGNDRSTDTPGTAPRLVTLTGAGGCGKTRLALEVAGWLWGEYEGAVWFVPLADLSEARLIAAAVRDAMELPRSAGADAPEEIVAALAVRPALLVLDNYEHLVVEGDEFICALRERLPDLRILVTSRQRLNLTGEREFAVLPLPVPNEALPASALLRSPSVQLFVDRAQAVRPTFQITPRNAPAIAALCEQLEGIPLALELAAARMQTLTPAQVLPRLTRRFDLLVSRERDAEPRHRTLRSAIGWSCQLLPPPLQKFFARLAVFRGGWTIAAAEEVCGATAEECLARLRESSLITVAEERGDEVRFGLLETLREYGWEELVRHGEADAARERHAAYYLRLAEEANPQLSGPDQRSGLDRLEQEHDNLRAALGWALERADMPLAMRFGVALWWFWLHRGYWREGRQSLEAILARERSCDADRSSRDLRRLRAGVLHGAGALAAGQGDDAAARAFHQESLAIRRELDDRGGIAASLFDLAGLACVQGDFTTGRALFEECLSIHRELGNRGGAASALGNLANVAHHLGDFGTATALHQEAAAIFRELGDQVRLAGAIDCLGYAAQGCGDLDAARIFHAESLAIRRPLDDRPGMAYSLVGLAAVARLQGDTARALALYRESLELRHRLGDQRGIGDCLRGLALVARDRGQPERAASLIAAAAAIRARIGVSRPEDPSSSEDPDIAALRAALGQGAFAAAWTVGQAMTLEMAVRAALDVQ